MANVLKISTLGDSVLRQIALPVNEDHPQLQEFISDLWATMYRTEGIGLAAPQVGKSIRVFVIDLDILKDEFPELKGFKKVFINPQVEILKGGKVAYNEGCLSIPGVNKKVTRPDAIQITYQDENFETHTDRYTGFASRVIQHEYDHLEGKLFVDYLNPLTKLLLSKKLHSNQK